MDPPSDLGGEDFEAFEPESTRGAVRRGRERRRNGEVISSVQADGLIDDPEITLELLKLMTHPVETAQ
jgi:hypothetical protein